MSDLKTACELLREGESASLGTLDESGAPFVSLVTIAPESSVRMILLLSGLAKHTQNLHRSNQCSLLIKAKSLAGVDPLTAARVTVSATAKQLPRDEDQSARTTFLTLHPKAEMYADFGDFSFYALDIHEAHLVAGFGRIKSFSAEQLLSYSHDNHE